MIEIDRTLLIADLSGYTALTEAHGALHASDIVLRLGRFAEASLESGVALVERVGDEVFYAGADTLAVVRTALRLRDAIEREPEFPTIRAGIHRGAVIERDGRFFGAALNLTARIASEARGGQVLCTAPVASAARERAGLAALPIGEKRFRNVASAVALFELEPREADPRDVALDPVCRMQVERARAVATVAHGGRTYRFCSLQCARTFVEAPQRFAIGADQPGGA